MPSVKAKEEENAAQQLRARIKNKTARVAVVGMGYVGLPLAVAFSEEGFQVTGIDVDAAKVKNLNAGESYISDIPSKQLAPLVNRKEKKLNAVTNYDILKEADAAIICVPTPLNKTKDPDVSFIVAATKEVAKRLHPSMLIVLESTSYPGTTEEIVLPILEESSLKVGTDFFLAFSPERIDPGREDWTVKNTPKVIGGITPVCNDAAKELYSSALDTVVPVSSPRAAEMVKLLENTFRAVNIAMVNEVAIMCDHLNLDVWEVINAAGTKPFGFMPFYPGPGLGGHCIPIDPKYLSWKLKTLDYKARFIELAEEINFSMPKHVRGKIRDALNERGKALKAAKILILGVAYKKDVSDTRDSPAHDLIKLLKEKGAEVSYHDPHVPGPIKPSGLCSIKLSDNALESADCVVIITNHSSYDWKRIVEKSRLVVDTRNAAGDISADNIIKL